MWDRYAENHEGVCLVFDAERLRANIVGSLAAQGLAHPHFGSVEYTPEGAFPRVHRLIVPTSPDEPSGSSHAAFVQQHHRDFFSLKALDWKSALRGMIGELVARGFLLVGALLLFVGPMLQALNELQEYEDLARASGLSALASSYLKLFVLALPWSKAPWWSWVTGLYWLFFPLKLAQITRQALLVVQQYSDVIAFIESESEQVGERERMKQALTKSRNWFVIGLGAGLASVGATVGVITTIVAMASN